MPRLDASVVEVYAFRRRSGRTQFLALRRQPRGSLPGIWQPITGTLRRGEPAGRGALRELREETGARPRRFWRLEGVSAFYDPGREAIRFIARFAAELDAHRSLVIFANDLLLYLPIHALERRETDGTWRFLAETHLVRYATQHEFADVVAAGPATGAVAPLLAVANPDGTLPAALTELREVRRVRGAVTALEGQAATKARLMELLELMDLGGTEEAKKAEVREKLADAYYRRDDYKSAMHAYQFLLKSIQSRNLPRPEGESDDEANPEVARVMKKIGKVLARRGDQDAAMTYYQGALQHYERLGQAVDVAELLNRMAWLYRMRDDLATARETAERAGAMLGFDVPKEAFVATSTAVALFVDGVRVPVYLAAHGGALLERWALIAAATLAVIAGTFLGRALLGRMREDVFRRVVSLFVFVLGVSMLFV